MNDMKSIRFPPPVADEMIRAILADRKTVTRRAVRQSAVDKFVLSQDNKVLGSFDNRHPGWGVYPAIDDSPYRPGDILYVRETWCECCLNENARKGHSDFCYKASYNSPVYGCIDKFAPQVCTWRPSIHMPKEAARLFMRVTDVRVERLQNITKEQALSEGVPDDSDYPLDNPVYCPKCKGEGIIGAIHPESLGYMETDCPYCDTPQKRFSNLWDSTIKKHADRALYGWAANPWVWVIEFERCEKPKEV